MKTKDIQNQYQSFMLWKKLSEEKPKERGWYVVMDKDACIDEANIEEWIPPSKHHDGYFEWVGMNGCAKPDNDVVYWYAVRILSSGKM